MNNNLDTVIGFWINKNNQNLKFAFPAKVVGIDKLSDGLIDVQPIVNHTNSTNSEIVTYPVIYDVTIMFPSTRNSTISFPVNQGDYVELIVQTVDIQKFVSGNGDVHDPSFSSYGNLSNVVAQVGFAPYTESCLNPNNYENEFDNQDLNIVHNKKSKNEVSITLRADGEVSIKSPNKVKVDAKDIELLSDRINANNAVLSTEGDVVVGGRSLRQFMEEYDRHIHIDGQGSSTSQPILGV